MVDIASGTVVKSAKVGGEPEGVKATPDGKLVYVTSEEAGTISVLDPEAGKILKTFKVGHRPRSVAFMPDGSKAYVNAENDGTVVVVDAVKQKMIDAIPLGKPGIIKPMAVLLSPDAARLYVSTGRGQQVFTIDTATEQSRRVRGGRRAAVGHCPLAGRQEALFGQRTFQRHLRHRCRHQYGGKEGQSGFEPVGRNRFGTVKSMRTASPLAILILAAAGILPLPLHAQPVNWRIDPLRALCTLTVGRF